jgi:hypothetical protein
MLKSNKRQSHSPKMKNIVQYSLIKWLTQGLWGCLFYNFYIFISYFVSQVLCICTDDRDFFSMRNTFFFIVMILIFIHLIIWWDIGIASESKLEVLENHDFHYYICSYFFLLFCLIILLYYYSNIPYMRVELQFIHICGWRR